MERNWDKTRNKSITRAETQNSTSTSTQINHIDHSLTRITPAATTGDLCGASISTLFNAVLATLTHHVCSAPRHQPKRGRVVTHFRHGRALAFFCSRSHEIVPRTRGVTDRLLRQVTHLRVNFIDVQVVTPLRHIAEGDTKPRLHATQHHPSTC